jgi:hypothetical protein
VMMVMLVMMMMMVVMMVMSKDHIFSVLLPVSFFLPVYLF